MTLSETVTEVTEKEDDAVELYKGESQYEIQTIEMEDIASESILCENILADVKNGYDNEEICRLYKDIIVDCETICNEGKDNSKGEVVPLWIDYAEYDINSDGLEDYIVLLSGCGYEGSEGITADILLRQEDGEFVWVSMPVSRYSEGSSEVFQYYMMLLDSGDERYPWLVLKNSDGLKIYGLEEIEDQTSHRYTGHAVSATILQREEEKEGLCCRVTEVFSEVGVTGWQHQAWIRVCESPERNGVSQVMTGECSHMVNLDRKSSLDIWDVNDDGFLDIVYDEGTVGGSGGSFSQYGVFVWDEQSKRYREYVFPLINRIDKEKHQLYVAYQSGAPDQYYVIYGLRDGQYEPFKELHLQYDAICEEEGNYIDKSRAIYSEWGEKVEETDISDLDWDETKELLERKYPEFTFWREG
ncbi:MAG: hypothetical protein ACI4F0_05990 [Agathobacter sp.]